MNKEQIKERNKARRDYFKAYRKQHRQELLDYGKSWYKAHKEDIKANMKAYYQEHKEDIKAYMKAYYQEHKEEAKAYQNADLNSLGQTKQSIRIKSQYYLKKYGTKIDGYEIHHCCTYTEPYKFIYCSRELHRIIHSYLKAHNIDADSEHYEQIKHLLDDSVVLYNI